jgi:RNA polymerase sigma-70 factor, ECF subfamily
VSEGAPAAPREAVATVFRTEFGRAVALLARVLGDVTLAEDAVQDAYVEALQRWPATGPPDHPGAWITTVARNRALDRLRRDRTLERQWPELTARLEQELPDDMLSEPDTIPDERLRLIFTCCHPALAPEAQLALTLRLVSGLTVPEIARGLLTTTDAVNQRLVRAKRKLRVARVELRVPEGEDLPDRLRVALAVVYVCFTEGYAATAGPRLVREELAGEAIRLGRLLVALMPDEAEPAGLLALMLLHHSRRGARQAADGSLVLLEDQDRTRWDSAAIAEGRALTERALRLRRPPGPYALQAAIAALHASAARPEETDWRQIAMLYRELDRIAPSPVIRLNRAAAVGMADGPAAGLAMLDAIDGLEGHHLWHAARAEMLRRLGREVQAAEAYRSAYDLATNEPERRFLAGRLAELL